MSRLVATLSVLVVLLLPQGASAWGPDGHRVVGSIADQMLTANAAAHVKALLGVGLREAGPWLDCVKSVKRASDGTLSYVTVDKYEEPCTPFANDHSAMVDYVGRNWVDCVYPEVPSVSANLGCHNTYHFDDVAVQRDRFDRNYAGTNDHDLVASTNAAIAVLLDRPAPPPFDIRNKREALFMLAHLVGDLGQPLHVGAVYLGPDGALVDPDVTHTIDPTTETAGGNQIKDPLSDEHDDANKNLHFAWDKTPAELGTTAPPALVDAAKALPPETGAIEDWSAAWASDTVLQAKKGWLTCSSPRPVPGSGRSPSPTAPITSRKRTISRSSSLRNPARDWPRSSTRSGRRIRAKRPTTMFEAMGFGGRALSKTALLLLK